MRIKNRRWGLYKREAKGTKHLSDRIRGKGEGRLHKENIASSSRAQRHVTLQISGVKKKKRSELNRQPNTPSKTTSKRNTGKKSVSSGGQSEEMRIQCARQTRVNRHNNKSEESGE